MNPEKPKMNNWLLLHPKLLEEFRKGTDVLPQEEAASGEPWDEESTLDHSCHDGSEEDDLEDFEKMTVDELVGWVESVEIELDTLPEEEKLLFSNNLSEKFFDLHMMFAPETPDECFVEVGEEIVVSSLEDTIEDLNPEEQEMQRKCAVLVDCVLYEFDQNQMTEEAALRLVDHIQRIIGGKDDA